MGGLGRARVDRACACLGGIVAIMRQVKGNPPLLSPVSDGPLSLTAKKGGKETAPQAPEGLISRELPTMRTQALCPYRLQWCSWTVLLDGIAREIPTVLVKGFAAFLSAFASVRALHFGLHLPPSVRQQTRRSCIGCTRSRASGPATRPNSPLFMNLSYTSIIFRISSACSGESARCDTARQCSGRPDHWVGATIGRRHFARREVWFDKSSCVTYLWTKEIKAVKGLARSVWSRKAKNATPNACLSALDDVCRFADSLS